jgi:hypothetical protein
MRASFTRNIRPLREGRTNFRATQCAMSRDLGPDFVIITASNPTQAGNYKALLTARMQAVRPLWPNTAYTTAT